MRKGSAAKNNGHRARKKLVYLKSLAEVPDFKSEDKVAARYQTHSTVLIQDQLETVPARDGGWLRQRISTRRNHNRLARNTRRVRSAPSA